MKRYRLDEEGTEPTRLPGTCPVSPNSALKDAGTPSSHPALSASLLFGEVPEFFSNCFSRGSSLSSRCNSICQHLPGSVESRLEAGENVWRVTRGNGVMWGGKKQDNDSRKRDLRSLFRTGHLTLDYSTEEPLLLLHSPQQTF